MGGIESGRSWESRDVRGGGGVACGPARTRIRMRDDLADGGEVHAGRVPAPAV